MKDNSSQLKQIFKEGSKTYFNSSVLFPPKVRADVTSLYAFVRVADDFVDSVPQDREGFYNFKKESLSALTTEEGSECNSFSSEKATDIVITSFVELYRRKGFKKEWVEAFLEAMEADLNKKSYRNIDETIDYMYGSAEVVGLMMAKVLDLPEESYESAKMLGRAMQYINFIRDVEEDITLDRVYLPNDAIQEAGLKELTRAESAAQPKKFATFIKRQIELYLYWQEQAELGFHYIPSRYRIPIQTASDMYKWTAKKIYNNPELIFKYKVKPSKFRILTKGISIASKFVYPSQMKKS